MKENFVKLLSVARHCLKSGKRKLSPNEFKEAIAAYNEINSWFHFYKEKLTDDNISNYIAKHGDKVKLIIPNNKNFDNLKNNLGL